MRADGIAHRVNPATMLAIGIEPDCKIQGLQAYESVLQCKPCKQALGQASPRTSKHKQFKHGIAKQERSKKRKYLAQRLKVCYTLGNKGKRALVEHKAVKGGM